MPTAPPWAAAASGVTLTVRLTPKGGRDAVEGIEQLADGRAVLKVRVAASPHEGAANDVLISLIAKTLGVPPRDVTLTAGATGRVKRLTIAGDARAAMAALEKIAPTRSKRA